jgi:hypothetical protein
MTLDEMWERLAQHQPYADERGYGPEWARMCEERTQESMSAAAIGTAVAAWAAKAAARAAWAAAKAVEWIEKAEGKN